MKIAPLTKRHSAQTRMALRSALGSGMNGPVYALAVSGSGLYAGGNFTMAGGSPANYIAKWDGTAWKPLGSGMNNYIFALAVSGRHLYGGGSFTTAGNKASAHVAKARIGSAAESITASGSSATIQFSGVVGYEYHVQRTDTLTPSMTWTTLTASPFHPPLMAHSVSSTPTRHPAPLITGWPISKQK